MYSKYSIYLLLWIYQRTDRLISCDFTDYRCVSIPIFDGSSLINSKSVDCTVVQFNHCVYNKFYKILLAFTSNMFFVSSVSSCWASNHSSNSYTRIACKKPSFTSARFSLFQFHIEACMQVKNLQEILIIGTNPAPQMEAFVKEMQTIYDVKIR